MVMTSDDEQDVIYVSSPFSSKSGKPGSSPGPKLTLKLGSPGQRKRARSLELDGDVLELKDVSNAKKAKREERKALTIVINAQKAHVVAAQHRWLYHHKYLFAPLLGAKSHFFANLEPAIKDLAPENRSIVKFEVIGEQPKMIKGGRMKDYQLRGLSFLVWMHRNGISSILGDEMGLGKTLQTLALLAYLKELSQDTMSNPHLIICPLSVLSSWLNEADRWVPNFRTIRFHGQASERTRLKNSFRDDRSDFDICVTTYDSFVAEDRWFKSKRWNYCVLDEGHKIRNSGTTLASKLQGIGASHRLILTGTPVHNNLGELWGLLHWLYPNVFTATTQNIFHESFDLSKGSYSLPFLTAAKKLLEKIMLRRTKTIVESSVPPREELTVFIPLTEAQRFWTYRLLTRMDTMDLKSIFPSTFDTDDIIDNGRRQVREILREQMNGQKEAKPAAWKRLMNLLIQLRMVCDHPYTLEDAEPSPYTIGEHLVASSSKLIVIDKILGDILPKGERVLLFSQWTGMLDLLEDFMALRKIPYGRLDGSTNRPRRNLEIRLFQQEKSPYQVFLISTKAGGLGINLTKATTVIMVDSDWNPQNDLQAIARAHRIGQTKIVKVYRLICRGSVEDQMLDRIRRKLFLSLKVIGSADLSTSENPSLGKNELLDILRRGSSALSTEGGNMGLAEFLKAPIGDILEVSRRMDKIKDTKIKSELPVDEVKMVETEEVLDAGFDQQALRDVEEEEMGLLKGIALVQSRLFEGKVVQTGSENKDIARAWKDVQQRARVDRLVMVDGMQVIADHIAPLVVTEPKSLKKEKRPKFEHEDWCHYCRDGGELVMCYRCPRVFHAECHGVGKAEVARNLMIMCRQHSCHMCFRNTGDAGGMLFRCRTCPQAFCEDCLPEDEIDAIGDTLPEFLLLGYHETPTVYFIRCHDCQNDFAKNPSLRESWQQEFAATEEKLRVMQKLEM